jgi:DNA replication protein DnaC
MVAMPKLLIIDEIGYLPFGREQSNLFSAQLLTRERPSESAPTSRKLFSL